MHPIRVKRRVGRSISERIALYSVVDASGCRVWMGSTNADGYAHLNVSGRTRRLTRLLWEAVEGPIPNGLSLMHKCDNRRCINLLHLSIGTHAENMGDMKRKRRARPCLGKANGMAKLTAEDVIAIRADRRPCPAIAADFGIARTTAWQIKSGRTWGHVR